MTGYNEFPLLQYCIVFDRYKGYISYVQCATPALTLTPRLRRTDLADSNMRVGAVGTYLCL